MADRNQEKAKRLQRRQWSVRNIVSGTPERPRLSVFRSSKHIYAQIVEDIGGRTLVAANSRQDGVLGDLKNGSNVASAQRVGKAIAEKARSAGIGLVVFDRGGRRYHGRVKALADAAREAGLKF